MALRNLKPCNLLALFFSVAAFIMVSSSEARAVSLNFDLFNGTGLPYGFELRVRPEQGDDIIVWFDFNQGSDVNLHYTDRDTPNDLSDDIATIAGTMIGTLTNHPVLGTVTGTWNLNFTYDNGFVTPHPGEIFRIGPQLGLNTGTLSLPNGIVLVLDDRPSGTTGNNFALLQNGQTVTGFGWYIGSQVPLGQAYADINFRADIPEPATAGLVGLGLMMFGPLRRRKLEANA